jgi:hypothetical protein
MHTPHGWIDLDPVFLESRSDVVVVDCLVTRVCLTRDPATSRGGLMVGQPVALEIRADAGLSPGVVVQYPRPGGLELPTPDMVRVLLERWIDEGADLSLLRDDGGDVLMLSRGEQLLALVLDRA